MDTESLKRQRVRIAIHGAVELKVGELEESTQGYSENISMGGMFVRCDEPRAAGTDLRFRLALDNVHGFVEGTARVVWVRQIAQGPGRPKGMGIRFKELEGSSRDILEGVIKRRLEESEAVPPPEGAPAPSWPTADGPGADAGLSLSEPLESRVLSPGELSGLETFPGELDELGALETPRPRAEWASPGRRRRRGRWWLWVGSAAALLLLGGGFYLLAPRIRSALGRDAELAPSPPVVAETEAGSEISLHDPAPEQIEVEPLPQLDPTSAATAPTGSPPADDGLEDSPATTSGEDARRGVVTRVERIGWTQAGGRTFVTIVVDGRLAPDRFSHFRVGSAPVREVLRIVGIRQPYAQALITVGTPELARIRTGLHLETADGELHVVFDLTDPGVRLSGIAARGNEIRLTFERQG